MAVLAFLFVVLAIGIFHYPTMFGPRQQTVFGWFENDVYLACSSSRPTSGCCGCVERR